MKFTRRQSLSFFGATTLFSMLPLSYLNAAMTSKFLILVELQGANDGLNTVIPYADRNYYKLRPTIGIPQKDILTINESVGLHFSLEGLAKIYETGELKIVQNLGYPNPVLSHFRSIELWETGGDGKAKGRNGWLNDSLNVIENQRNLDGKAIYLDQSGDVFRGGLDGFYGPNSIGFAAAELEARDQTVPVPKTFGLLADLMQGREQNSKKLKQIQNKLSGANRFSSIGRGDLGAQLSKVCNILSKGVNIPVLKVAIGSFDTHSEQFWRHRDLLRELDESLYETVQALQNIGIWNDTVIMTYSEFGRRAAENGSRGTDHGMAAPHFLMGGKIKGGFVGEVPNLGRLRNNNLEFEIDYRTVYETVLREHFGLVDNPFQKYQNKDLFSL
ncbi:MAG: hypothetical protein CMM80_06425 [Rhodospirillaceae bacterium]|nr:hypothetical protein [Rhodospirillaceae bacterium]